MEMVRKYAHLSSEHLVEYVDRLPKLKLGWNESAEIAAAWLRQKKVKHLCLTL